jgi:hypothetical protein
MSSDYQARIASVIVQAARDEERELSALGKSVFFMPKFVFMYLVGETITV